MMIVFLVIVFALVKADEEIDGRKLFSELMIRYPQCVIYEYYHGDFFARETLDRICATRTRREELCEELHTKHIVEPDESECGIFSPSDFLLCGIGCRHVFEKKAGFFIEFVDDEYICTVTYPIEEYWNLSIEDAVNEIEKTETKKNVQIYNNTFYGSFVIVDNRSPVEFK